MFWSLTNLGSKIQEFSSDVNWLQRDRLVPSPLKSCLDFGQRIHNWHDIWQVYTGAWKKKKMSRDICNELILDKKAKQASFVTWKSGS